MSQSQETLGGTHGSEKAGPGEAGRRKECFMSQQEYRPGMGSSVGSKWSQKRAQTGTDVSKTPHFLRLRGWRLVVPKLYQRHTDYAKLRSSPKEKKREATEVSRERRDLVGEAA